MFARKKEDKSKRRTGGMPQLGIFGVPDDIDNFDPDGDNSEDDEDLEAELFALTSGGPSKPKKPAPVKVKPQDLGIMVAASLKDIPSDDEVSVDEDDPELMAELGELAEEQMEPEKSSEPVKGPSSPVAPMGSQLVSLLKERLQMYEMAEGNAKVAGETSRARRFSRGIKTLKEQLSHASAGKVVNEADIPPPVAIGERPKDGTKERNEADMSTSGSLPHQVPCPQPPASPPSVTTPSDDVRVTTAHQESHEIILTTLNERRNAYRREALVAKKNGDNDAALKCVRIVKQFDSVIAAVKSGQPVDLSEMPPMPQEESTVPLIPTREAPKPPPRARTSLVTKSEPLESAEEEVGNQVPPKAPPPLPPPPPTSVLEALEQRLQRFKEAEQSAKEEGNSSKARRLGRIVKQYQTAISDHKKGKPVPYEELPTPPGFAPIPGQPAPKPPESADDGREEEVTGQDLPSSEPTKPEVSPDKLATRPSASSSNSAGKIETPGPVSGPGGQSTRLDRQLDVLVKRQAEFKKAALEAKKRGDVAQAREHLRIAKGIDPLIEATRSGFPVDMDTLPLPPEEKAALLETDFDFVSVEECTPGSIAEIYERLEEDLSKQVMMCMNTRDHFRAIGDVSSGNRFEQMALHSKKDLDAVRAAFAAHKVEMSGMGEDGTKKTAPPRFHYENKTFSIVQCNTDLSDNDVELTILRGINYNISNDSDTYVRFEFPYPTDTPQKDRTQTVRGNNPVYEQSFMLNMQRTARPCQRIFKRHAVKLELWLRGGFFRGDSLIGTATVKLQPLETVCTLHDSFPLMEGRKAVGGKMEVKIRVRNPILARQVEKVTEKWLVIDRL